MLQPEKQIKLVATDLDGTLLKDDKTVSHQDIEMLYKLGDLGIIRVAATGRNLKICHEVLDNDFPIDYLVFSTGSGVLDWKKQQIIKHTFLSSGEIEKVLHVFREEKFDFTIHHPIPENFRFYYHVENTGNTNFMDYVNRYSTHGDALHIRKNSIKKATQCMAIVEGEPDIYQKIKEKLPGLKIIRTTSPIDHSAMWIEVFPASTSKATGIKHIGVLHKISEKEMAGVGNDFNDVDFLDLVKYPFVVANAHPELINQYPKVDSNENSGFSKAISKCINTKA